VWKDSRVQQQDEDDDRPSRDEPERTPDTPTDEPKPAPVQDPPAEPGRPPLVVARREIFGLEPQQESSL
jgi:hypothetical protein